MYREHTIAVVVPVYDEEKFIGKVLSDIPSFVDKIIIVNDGSTDKSKEVINEFRETLGERLCVIEHEKNIGVGAAIVDGYKASLKMEVDITVVVAGDAQMDTEKMPLLLDPIISGSADYTKGNRLQSPEKLRMPRGRLYGNSILTLLTKIASGYWDIVDPQNGYTAISKKALRTINLEKIERRYGYCNVIISHLNIYDFKIVDVIMPPIYGDEVSDIKIGRFSFKMMWLITKSFFYRIWKKYGGLNLHPILLFYAMGLLLTAIGSVMGIYAIMYRLGGTAPTPGTASLISLLLILGIQNLFFGMMFDVLQTQKPKTTKGGISETSEIKKSVMDKKYSSKSNRPSTLISIVGAMVFLIGCAIGLSTLNDKILTGTITVGTAILTSLLLIVGFQMIVYSKFIDHFAR